MPYVIDFIHYHLFQAAFREGAQEKLDTFFDKLEALLVSNKGGDGYFVGDSVSNNRITVRYYHLSIVQYSNYTI